jgi:hypothetical protein
LASTRRLDQDELHGRFLEALGPSVVGHSGVETKPMEVDLRPPLPPRIRVYLFNATRPPGGRPAGEFKIQLMASGQGRGERGSFDTSGGRLVIVAGYAVDEDVFILWDGGLYKDFAWSRNVQVRSETVLEAFSGAIGRQERNLRPADGARVTETVVTAAPARLGEALTFRMDLTRRRLLGEE